MKIINKKKLNKDYIVLKTPILKLSKINQFGIKNVNSGMQFHLKITVILNLQNQFQTDLRML